VPHERAVVLEAGRREHVAEHRRRHVHRGLAGASGGALDPALGGAQLRIHRLDDAEDLAVRLDPHREVAVADRHDHREHPVVAAVLGPVLDVGGHGLVALEVVPQQAERAPRRVEVADDVVRLADQLLARVGADADEDAVARGDDPLAVGRREEELVGPELALVLEGVTSCGGVSDAAAGSELAEFGISLREIDRAPPARHGRNYGTRLPWTGELRRKDSL
jgi:hypothetical protein